MRCSSRSRRRRRCPASRASDLRRVFVHSDLSRCQSLRILPCLRHSSATSLTFFSSWWPSASCCSSTCCLRISVRFLATAASSLSAASANSCTPSSTSCVGDGVERNAGAGEFVQRALRFGGIFLKAVAQLAVIAECVHRRHRHGVDGVGTDQLLDIEHVAIGLVLGAGRRPKQPLRLGALAASAPAIARRRSAADKSDRPIWHWRWRFFPSAH